MRVSILAILAVCYFSTPAFAQSKKELAAQDAQLAKRISTLESRMLTGDPAAERLMQRMDSLETSVRTLTGELERVRYERDTLRKELEALSGDIRAVQDLSNRMKIHLDAVDLIASETKNKNSPRTYSGPTYDTGGVQPSAVPSAPVQREQPLPVQQEYVEAAKLPGQGQRLLAEGDFSGAQTAFKQYLTVNPDAADFGEVSYWLGEAYFVKGGYADAADAYISSMRKAPSGTKAPEAMIRLAAAMRELGNRQEACQTLASFPAQFPSAPASVKEKARVETVRTGC